MQVGVFALKVFDLKLAAGGFPRASLAASALINFPMQLVTALFMSRLMEGKPLSLVPPFYPSICDAVNLSIDVNIDCGLISGSHRTSYSSPWWSCQLCSSSTCRRQSLGLSPSQSSLSSHFTQSPILFDSLPWYTTSSLFDRICRPSFSNGQGAFFAAISDPKIGGTYLTLLNTISNFGGAWPKYFVLKLVDVATASSCFVDGIEGEPFSSRINCHPYLRR